MSTKPPYESFDELIRQQMNQLSPEVPEGVWEAMESSLDAMNESLQFDQAVRESMNQLQVPAPQGVFEAIQSQLGQAGAGIGSGLGLGAKWILGGLIGGAITLASVLYYQEKEEGIVQADPQEIQVTKPELKETEPAEISRNETEPKQELSVTPEAPETRNHSSHQPGPNPTEPVQREEGNTPPQNDFSFNGNQDALPQGGVPNGLPVIPQENKLDPVIGFSASDTFLCMGNAYAVQVMHADDCRFEVYLDGALIGRLKGSETRFAYTMNQAGDYQIECKVIRGGESWSQIQKVHVVEPPVLRVDMSDLGRGKYAFTCGQTGTIRWELDGVKQSSNIIQLYDPLPKDHTMVAKMKDQYGCEAKAQYLFRNNFIFEVKEPNIPNAFTPNGDGINDEFYVEIKGATYFRIYILNANSQIVFESSNPDERWNGHDKHRGNEIHPGFYTCIIEYALAGGEIKKDQRNVQLLKE